MDDPAWKLCGPLTHSHAHPHTTTRPARVGSPPSRPIQEHFFWVFFSLLRVCRHLLSGPRTTVSRAPEPARVFILHAVTCGSFHRYRLLSHSAHSALFINTQTQEVLFIRQSDRDQLGVRRRACSKRRLWRPLRTHGGRGRGGGCCVLLNISGMIVVFFRYPASYLG